MTALVKPSKIVLWHTCLLYKLCEIETTPPPPRPLKYGSYCIGYTTTANHLLLKIRIFHFISDNIEGFVKIAYILQKRYVLYIKGFSKHSNPFKERFYDP